MSEEKLTVAELMARAAKEGHSTDAPRRRRRRSLEDGGVSVAELTGSIPAVKEKPAESKHSAVKIDDPAGIQDTTRDDAAPAPEPADAPAEVKAATEPVEQTKQAKPVAPAAPVTPVAPVAPVAPEKAEPKKPEPQAVAKAEPKPAAKAEAKQEPKAEKKAEPESTPAAKPTVERPAPSNEETMVLSIVDEKDPIRLTTGAFPVVPASAVKSAPAPKTPAKAKDAEAAADAEFASTTPGGQRFSSPADTTQMDATTGEIEVTDTADEHPDEGSGKVSVVSVILMAIVGVVLGAAVFLAFEMLWERLSTWLVAVLAVAVTLGMVGIVHALRTSRDGFSMALAGVVGLVMTFGPLLIVI